MSLLRGLSGDLSRNIFDFLLCLKEAVPHRRDESIGVFLNHGLAVETAVNLSDILLNTGVDRFVQGQADLVNDLFGVVVQPCRRDQRVRRTYLRSCCDS